MERSPAASSRRNFLQLAAVGAAGFAAAPTALIARAHRAYPPDVGSKFYPDGRVHPFPGNTIVCHLPQQGDRAACFNSLLDIYREAPTHRFMRKITVLPPSSYHMTIFSGITDRSRKPENWPADLPLDMPLEAVSRTLGDRLRNFEPAVPLPIRMRVDPVQEPLKGGALIFRLQPFDDVENTKLRRLRDRLADVLKLQPPGHDRYQFHISFGYKIAWLDSAEERDLVETWRHWAAHIAEKNPEILLDGPEYCTFDDMFAFHRQFYI